MSNWTQPCCERCWIRDNTEVVQLGEPAYKVRRPVVIRDSPIEVCCKCGQFTIMGIYIRIDPSTVEFPSKET